MKGLQSYGRYISSLTRQNRYCTFCTDDIEDELHLVLNCTMFSCLRKKKS